MKSSSKSKPSTYRKKRFCLEAECKLEAITNGYCRLHYIANWRHIQFNHQIKAERRLNAYVDRLAKKYPRDYLERIKEGLESEEKFKASMEEVAMEAEPETSETEQEFLEKFLRDIKVGAE